LDFNDIVKEYNLKKIELSGRLLYYIGNSEFNVLYFLPSEIYQNLIMTTRKFYKFFLLTVYHVNNIKEIIKCFMEFRNLPSSKYIISATKNIDIEFIIAKNEFYNIDDMVNIDYIILEEILEEGKYKYKLPFSDIFIKENY